DPAHGAERQRAIEVREEGTAAGGFPFKPGAKGVGVDRDDNEVALAREMLRGGLRDLIGGGEMDVAVGEIDRRAGKFACTFGRAPRGGVENFGDRFGTGSGSHNRTTIDSRYR